MLSCQIRDGLAWATVLSPAFVSGRELLDSLRSLERVTHFPPGTGLLLDGRAITEARGHPQAELSTVALELVNLGIGRCAVVPAPARLDQALRFVGVAKTEALPMAVFLDPEPAVRWLLRAGHNERPEPLASEDMTAEGRLGRVLAMVRTLLVPMPLGKGPIRMEDWSTLAWNDRQRDAFAHLCHEAGIDLGPDMPEE